MVHPIRPTDSVIHPFHRRIVSCRVLPSFCRLPGPGLLAGAPGRDIPVSGLAQIRRERPDRGSARHGCPVRGTGIEGDVPLGAGTRSGVSNHTRAANLRWCPGHGRCKRHCRGDVFPWCHAAGIRTLGDEFGIRVAALSDESSLDSLDRHGHRHGLRIWPCLSYDRQPVRRCPCPRPDQFRGISRHRCRWACSQSRAWGDRPGVEAPDHVEFARRLELSSKLGIGEGTVGPTPSREWGDRPGVEAPDHVEFARRLELSSKLGIGEGTVGPTQTSLIVKI